MNLMHAISKTATNLRAFVDEAASLANVRPNAWGAGETERLLRLGSAAGDASAGVAALKGVKFTGTHREAVRGALQSMTDISVRVQNTSKSLGQHVAAQGRGGIHGEELRHVSAAAAPLADTLQAIRNLVYRP